MATKPISAIGPDLSKFLKRFNSKGTMQSMGTEARNLIKLRTRTGGKGSDDNKLDPLNPKTVAQKAKRGRPQPSKSRLTDSNEMLDSMKVKSIFGRAIIYFKSQEMAERARHNEERGRVFFDISDQDERKLWDHIRDLYRKIVNLGV